MKRGHRVQSDWALLEKTGGPSAPESENDSLLRERLLDEEVALGEWQDLEP